MNNLIVNGGTKLAGKVKPSGNKNAAVAMIPATLLTKEPVILKNVPDITDLEKFVDILEKMGSKIKWDREGGVLEIENKDLHLDSFEGHLPLGMRASIMLLVPLALRMKSFSIVPQIGGCCLGVRELDPHLKVLEKLGAKLSYSSDLLGIDLDNNFSGTEYWADYASVTATENFAMGAVLAKGKSILMNAASEPHVQNLLNFLVSMGAKVKGVGSSKLEIEGVDELHGTEFEIISDHHEITTYLALGAMTGGKVEVENAIPEHFGLINDSFEKLGVEVKYKGNTAYVEENQKLEIKQPYTSYLVPKIEAAPWPYFPADLLPLMMALATKAKGQMLFWNKVYDASFTWIPQLTGFGVKYLMCDPHRVLVWGGLPLRPAIIDAPDIIRATVALYMIAQSINGESIIRNADPIKRAHPNFAEKMLSLGAQVRWEH